MTTVEEARQISGEWVVEGKMVNKRVFCHKDKENRSRRMMSLTFIDSDGTLFDIQTRNIRKFYLLFRKLNPDECYMIRGREAFEMPNKQYSTSKYLFKKWWWIEPLEQQIRLKKSLPCQVNLNKTIKTLKQGQPENLLGLFLGLDLGPARYSYNKPLIQGYYVRLLDEEGKQYRVLVWHVTYVKGNKFALHDARQGDDVLITCVRSSYLNPDVGDGDRLYTLTSIVPPVLNSKCVSNRRRQDLKRV